MVGLNPDPSSRLELQKYFAASMAFFCCRTIGPDVGHDLCSLEIDAVFRLCGVFPGYPIS